MRENVPLRNDWRWPPLPARVPTRGSEVIRRLHDEAMQTGRTMYLDPLTGLSVFTAAFLADRGYCCDSGCRHCPYQPDSSTSPATVRD
ncbi:MAG: DUF5522 domain-containing protein [Actinomycetota bacterium]